MSSKSQRCQKGGIAPSIKCSTSSSTSLVISPPTLAKSSSAPLSISPKKSVVSDELETNFPVVVGDLDLFSCLSAMNLSNAAAGSRKRKILENALACLEDDSESEGFVGKMVNSLRPPALRELVGDCKSKTSSNATDTLTTPQNSQSGFDEVRKTVHSIFTPEAINEATVSIMPCPVTDIFTELHDNVSTSFDESLGLDLGCSVEEEGHSSNLMMSEALLALPNLSISTVANNGNNLICVKREKYDEPPEFCHPTDSIDTLIKPSKITSPSAAIIGRFQYVLVAPISTSTKSNEETVTYINKGQSYELQMRHYAADNDSHIRPAEISYFYSTLRLSFQSRRLQMVEAEQVAAWIDAHTGQRLLELDVPMSLGISEPHQSSDRPNEVSFRWHASGSEVVSAFIRINCISSEFTPRKHGGEKGVQFRLQVETRTLSDETLIMSKKDRRKQKTVSACVLQVFQLKGADRKYRQDQQKLARKTAAEREKYTSPSQLTILTNYSNYLNLPAPTYSSTPSSPTTSPVPNDSDSLIHNSLPVVSELDDANTISKYLSFHNFGAKTQSNLKHYRGCDLFRLSREDFISLCGLPDALRLYNEIRHLKEASCPTFASVWLVVPETTPINTFDGIAVFEALYLTHLSLSNLLTKLANVSADKRLSFVDAYIYGPHGILVKLTDDGVAQIPSHSIFKYTLRAREEDESFDVIFHDITSRLHQVSADASSTVPSLPATSQNEKL